jgi:hypothetical protein
VPDFEAVIRCRLPKLWLGREREAEVIAELASYLEDCADDGREPEGACNAVPWGRFGFQIRRAKENAMDRMKQIMIPATAAMAVSGAIQVGCYFLGLRTFVFPTSNTAVVFQWPWLVALPLAGATGAYIARRSGASPFRRVIAALAPAWLLMATFAALSIPAIIIGDLRHAANWVGFGAMLLSWVAIPAVPLVLGASPFLGGAETARHTDHTLGAATSA